MVRVPSASFIEKREHQFAFRDDGIVNDAMTFRFCQAIAARSCQFRVNENRVPRENRFAKFNLVRTHEVADTTRRLR